MPKTELREALRQLLKNRRKSPGFGERSILLSGKLYHGFWAGVVMQPVKKRRAKTGREGRSFQTDDGEGFHRLIPEDTRVACDDFAGKIQSVGNLYALGLRAASPSMGCRLAQNAFASAPVNGAQGFGQPCMTRRHARREAER